MHLRASLRQREKRQTLMHAQADLRLMVGLLNVMMPKVVLLMACLAYLRGRSTRSFWLHFTLVVLSAVVCLALSFVNLGLFWLCEQYKKQVKFGCALSVGP